ncbi:nuclease-related domain-containing protein [Sulfuricystis multivorans]|uniref:nuclease-related domain-containing protein n=1 Tax=Sulfuricystis multivorans TaxID=2211108 RepID=UPI0024E00F6E|nr:nuclease-related domain-containing protein [Sulfuricystis multivorans]
MQRKRAPTANKQAEHYPERPSPSVMALSNYGTHLLAEVERKRQASEEAIRKHQAALEEIAVEEAKIRSGLEGESRLDDFLRSRLDDTWTIIAGYRAHEGEIDRILVGPKGVFAFEVKNVGGIIHCDGDRWWRDKTDRRGNIIERDVPIADNGGRSPSRQINDAADALERLLKGNGHDAAVVRIVVLTHPRARLGNISRLNIHLLARVQDLYMQRVLSRGAPLSADQARKIATTIRRHHEWFERKEKQSARRDDEPLNQAFSPSP